MRFSEIFSSTREFKQRLGYLSEGLQHCSDMKHFERLAWGMFY